VADTNIKPGKFIALLIEAIRSGTSKVDRIPFIHFTPTASIDKISHGECVDNFLSRVLIFKRFNRFIHKGYIVPLKFKKYFDDIEYLGKEETELIGLEEVSWKETDTTTKQ